MPRRATHGVPARQRERQKPSNQPIAQQIPGGDANSLPGNARVQVRSCAIGTIFHQRRASQSSAVDVTGLPPSHRDITNAFSANRKKKKKQTQKEKPVSLILERQATQDKEGYRNWVSECRSRRVSERVELAQYGRRLTHRRKGQGWPAFCHAFIERVTTPK